MYKVINLKSILGDYEVEFVQQLADITNVMDQPNTVTVIDSNVARLYPDLHRETNIVIESIESNKTFEGAQELLDIMVQRGIKSNTTVVVIGGGILQDLVGFCCSIYNRGIKYILVPTTLLAQADSCIGGKTSINFNKKKNILGTFYPPVRVLTFTGFLSTLSDIEYVSGLGEVFKFAILQSNVQNFQRAMSKKVENDIVYESLLYKKHIVDIDEFDRKERKFLNFGHTFGHALEFTSNNAIPHGVGVILGCVVSCLISTKLNYRVQDMDLILRLAKELLNDIELNPVWFDSTSILDAVKMDKKNTGKIVDVLIDVTPTLVELYDMSIINEALLHTYQLIRPNETI